MTKKTVEKAKKATATFSIRNPDENSTAAFKKIHKELIRRNQSDKEILASDVFAFIMDNFNEKPGAALKETETIITKQNLQELHKQNQKLQEDNSLLNSQIEGYKESAELKINELQDQINHLNGTKEATEQELEKNYRSTIETLTTQIDELQNQLADAKKDAVVLKSDEFICKLKPEVIEIADKCRITLQKSGVIQYDEYSSYPEELANYCIKELLSLTHKHLLK